MIRTIKIALSVILFLRAGIDALARQAYRTAELLSARGYALANAKAHADLETARSRAEAAQAEYDAAAAALPGKVRAASRAFPVVL